MVASRRGRWTRPFALGLGVVLLVLVSAAGTTPSGAAEEPAAPRDGRQTRIVGGTQAPAGAWPAQAALVPPGERPEDYQFCGATVIAWSWVVTAAHCTYAVDEWTGEHRPARPSEIDVVANTQRLSAPGTRTRVAEIRRLLGWNPDNQTRNPYYRDLALLRLTTPPGPGTRLMPLIAAGATVAPGTMATTVGWGDTVGEGGDEANYPDELRQVDVPIVADDTCEDNYPHLPLQFDRSSMVCAGFAAGGKDSCQGDSGGPLMIPRPGGGYQLMGIVSWGEGCADPNRPGVYTRLNQFSSWVRGQVRFGALSNSLAFVDRQYRDLYGRTATYGEFQTHAAESSPLNTQQISPSAWIRDRIQGPYQSTAGGVARLYRAFFERDPDTGGLAYWTAKVQQGTPLGRIAELFALSGEFEAEYGNLTDEGYVDRVYQNVLGRAADDGGRDHWLGELQSGRLNRGTLMLRFSESGEFRTAVKGRIDTIITHFGLLRRVPTPAEITVWQDYPNLSLVTALFTSRSYDLRF